MFKRKSSFQIELFVSYFAIVLFSILCVFAVGRVFFNKISRVSFERIKSLQTSNQHIQNLRGDYFKYLRIIELCTSGEVDSAETGFKEVEEGVSEDFEFLKGKYGINDKTLEDVKYTQVQLSHLINRLIMEYEKKKVSIQMTFDELNELKIKIATVLKDIEGVEKAIDSSLLQLEQNIAEKLNLGSINVRFVISTVKRQFLIYTAVFILLSAIMSLLLTLVVSRPIVYSNRLMQKLAEKDLTAIAGMDKYDILFSAAEKMSKSLQAIILESRQILIIIENAQKKFIDEIDVMSGRLSQGSGRVENIRGEVTNMKELLGGIDREIDEKGKSIEELIKLTDGNGDLIQNISGDEKANFDGVEDLRKRLDDLKLLLEKVDVYAVNIGIESSRDSSTSKGYKVIADEIRNVVENGDLILNDIKSIDSGLKTKLEVSIKHLGDVQDGIISQKQGLVQLSLKANKLRENIISEESKTEDFLQNIDELKVMFRESNEWLIDMKNTFVQLTDRINRLNSIISGFRLDEKRVDKKVAEIPGEEDDIAVRTVFG